MPDPLMLADVRPARLVRTVPGALELVGRSVTISRVQEVVRRAALVDGGVLIVGERGVDAESVARELHLKSRHASAPYVVVQCADDDTRLLLGPQRSEAPTDLESISADSRLAAARGGTLMLQDVVELPAAVQARLARIARDGEARVDGEPFPLDCRLIASALPGIDGDVQGHRFRADLYRRLAAIRIDLPPLRERPDDVPVLAHRLLEELCAGHHVPARTFTQAALALLGALTWPGNLAELHGVIERVVSDTHDEVVQVEHLLPALRLDRVASPFVPAGNLREARLRFEREYIAAVLQHHGWRMADAAHALGIQRPNLYRKARQLGIPLVRLSE